MGTKVIKSHNGLVIAKVKSSNHRETYAGLLWWQRHKGLKPGWVFYKFIEIYGKKPRPLSTVEPLAPDQDLREYLGIMKNRWKQKKRREKAKAYRLASDASQYRGEAQAGSEILPPV